jgi:hypothetical protein
VHFIDVVKNLVVILNDNSGIAILVSCISTLISAIAVGTALYFNAKTQKQYRKSLEPQLTMRLDRYDYFLYLIIQNTGRTAAQNISVKVNTVEDNGDYKLSEAITFDSFELYPNEMICRGILPSVETLATSELCPSVNVDVSYQIDGTKKGHKYSRKIAFSKMLGTKVLADVNMDLRNIEAMLTATARAEVRTANYLDGRQVGVIDELDILAHRSLQNDLCSVLKSGTAKEILDRPATIHEALRGNKKTNANTGERRRGGNECIIQSRYGLLIQQILKCLITRRRSQNNKRQNPKSDRK